MGKYNRSRWRPVANDAGVHDESGFAASPKASTRVWEDKIKDQELQLQECRKESELLSQASEAKIKDPGLQLQAGDCQLQLADNMLVAELQKEVQNLQSLLGEASGQRSTLEKQLKDRDIKLGMYRREVDMLQSMRKEVTSSFSEMQALIKEKDEKLLVCNNTIDDLETLSEDWSNERMFLLGELEDRTNQLQSLQSIHGIVCGFGAALESQAEIRELNLNECRAEIESLKASCAQDTIKLTATSAENHLLEEQVQRAEHELRCASECHKMLHEEISTLKTAHLSAKASWQGGLLRHARTASLQAVYTCLYAWHQQVITNRQQRRHSHLHLTLTSMLENTSMRAILRMCWMAWCHVLRPPEMDTVNKLLATPGTSEVSTARGASPPTPIMLSSGSAPTQNAVFRFESKPATVTSSGPPRNGTFPFASKSEVITRHTPTPRLVDPQRAPASNGQSPTRCAAVARSSFMTIPQACKGGNDSFVTPFMKPVPGVAWKR